MVNRRQAGCTGKGKAVGGAIIFSRSPSNPAKACLLACAHAASQVGTRQRVATSQIARLSSILRSCLRCDEYQIRNALLGDQDHELQQQSDPNLNLNSITESLCDIENSFPDRRWSQGLGRHCSVSGTVPGFELFAPLLLNPMIFHLRVTCYFKTRRKGRIPVYRFHRREKLRNRSQEGQGEPSQTVQACCPGRQNMQRPRLA